MELGLAAMRYNNGDGNTITSYYAGLLPPVKKPDEQTKVIDTNTVADNNTAVKKPEFKSYSGIRG